MRGRPRRPAAAEAAAPGGAAGTPAAERAMRVARWLAGLLCPLSLLLTQSRGVRFHPGQGKQAVTKGGDRPGGGGGVPALRAGRRRRRRERFLAVGCVCGSSDRSGVWRQGGPSCPVPPPPFPVPLLSLDTWLVPRVTCREPFGWRFTAVLLGQAESLLAFCCRDLSEAALLVRNCHARPGE